MGRVIRWTLFVVVLVIFASGAVAFYTVFFRPSGEAAVPTLRERSVVDAVAEAERLGFVVQIEPVASTLPEGRVLAQSPEPGTNARKKQVIVLQVSRGGELHAVPDVRGQTLAKAQSVIKEQGFSLGDVIRIRDGSQPGGSVIAQSPAAPANIASGRKIDLLIQDGAGSRNLNSDGSVIIPDVNRKTESEARNILEAAGVKIQAVDRVYSPLLPEGLAIETKPGAGTSLKSGQGVILKLATQRRPAGYIDANSNSSSSSAQNQNSSVRRVTNQPPTAQQNNSTQETFTSENTTTTPVNNNNNNLTPAPVQQPSAPTSSGSKTARIRYQVPPLASPMNLRIELTDPSGKRDVLNRQVRSGENINIQANYSQECVITIYLGGQSVWQERQR